MSEGFNAENRIYSGGARLCVVRHGERLDEANPSEWIAKTQEAYQGAKNSTMRLQDCMLNDAPLTDSGIEMAKEAGMCMKKLSEEPNTPLTGMKCIYSSRLVRAVQTAYEIAKALDLPLVISSQLSCTAVAVSDFAHPDNSKRNGWQGFEFVSLEELKSLCPDVKVYSLDSDSSTTSFYCHFGGSPSGQCCDAFKCPPELRFNVDLDRTNYASNPWYRALSYVTAVGSAETTMIVVAHRETIRGLEERGPDPMKTWSRRNRLQANSSRDAIDWRKTRLPYCAIGIYQSAGVTVADGELDPNGGGERRVTMERLYNHRCEPLKLTFL